MTHDQDTGVFDNQENYQKSYKRLWEEIARLRLQRDRALAEQDAIKDLLLLLQDDLADGLRLKQKTFAALVKLGGYNP